MSKQKTIKTEAQLRQAAKEALEADALLRWRWKAFELKRERGADALLELNVDGRRLVFEVEFKLTPSAREVERLAQRGGTRPGLLIALVCSPSPQPSPGLRELRTSSVLRTPSPHLMRRRESPAPASEEPGHGQPRRIAHGGLGGACARRSFLRSEPDWRSTH